MIWLEVWLQVAEKREEEIFFSKGFAFHSCLANLSLLKELAWEVGNAISTVTPHQVNF